VRIIAVADLLFELYTWILVARFLLTWIPSVDYSHPVVRFIHRATDVVVRPFRGILPPMGAIDFSPLLMFLVLRMAYSLLRRLLFVFAF
jgi:YggT family protein